MRSLLTLLAFTTVLTAQTLVGDGQADDTAALQKLIDGGGTVSLAKGRYRLTKTVTVDLAKLGAAGISSDGTATLIMAGPGPALKIIGTHGGTAAPKSFKPETWAQRTPVVQGLEIIGAHPEADGLEATGTMQLTLSRLTIREARHAIHLTVRNRNIVISDCHLYRNRGVGLFLDNVNLHQTNITGCHISYNLGGGIVAVGGEVRNLHVGTCDIEANHDENGPPSANILLDSTGGYWPRAAPATSRRTTTRTARPRPISSLIRPEARSPRSRSPAAPSSTPTRHRARPTSASSGPAKTPPCSAVKAANIRARGT
jgi:hypothetical protein